MHANACNKVKSSNANKILQHHPICSTKCIQARALYSSGNKEGNNQDRALKHPKTKYPLWEAKQCFSGRTE